MSQYRNVNSAEELTEETEQAAEQYDKRSVSYGYDHNGMVKVQAHLPALEGTAFIRSLQRAEDVLFTSAEASGVADETRRTVRQLRADALELLAARVPISRAIIARDCHCQFPGCTAHRHLQIHHIKHWDKDGETSVVNGVIYLRIRADIQNVAYLW